MDLEKLIGKNKAAAESLVKNLKRDISKNQRALKRNAEDHETLMEEGKELTLKLAAADEYLDDLLLAEKQ